VRYAAVSASFASDEEGEPAGCLSECNPNQHHDGQPASPTAGARRCGPLMMRALFASDEANLQAACQSAIQTSTMTGSLLRRLQELPVVAR